MASFLQPFLTQKEGLALTPSSQPQKKGMHHAMPWLMQLLQHKQRHTRDTRWRCAHTQGAPSSHAFPTMRITPAPSLKPQAQSTPIAIALATWRGTNLGTTRPDAPPSASTQPACLSEEKRQPQVDLKRTASPAQARQHPSLYPVASLARCHSRASAASVRQALSLAQLSAQWLHLPPGGGCRWPAAARWARPRGRSR